MVVTISEKVDETKSNLEYKKTSWELFYLSQFFDKSFTTIDYLPDKRFADIISLTSYGEMFAKLLKKGDKNIENFEINYLLFIIFGHEDIFIDPIKTDINAIRCILDDEIINHKIMYPWEFDRLLYDRFFDIYKEEPPERLSYEESAELLEKSPIGVFQLGNNLVGPYGLLNSACKRELKPTLSLPLWHCPSPICSNIHYVILLNRNERLSQTSKVLLEKLNSIIYPNKDWMKIYENIWNINQEFFDDLLLQDLPYFLMAAFNLNESRLILKKLIEANSKEIRALFPKRHNFQKFFIADSASIIKDLDKNQCLQLILLMEDNIIIHAVESLISDKIIDIPATEIRAPEIYNRDKWNWYVTKIECSRFGIRNSEPSGGLALSRLRRLIKNVYDKKNEMSQLDWKLRHIKGDSLFEKLDRYIFSEDPEKIIYELILDNIIHLDKSFELLRHGNFYKPKNIDEEKLIIKKILWKLGFDIYLYPDYIDLFWKRSDKFIVSSRLKLNYNEEDREKIRSSAANFFVSLEQVLNYSLSFITWTLLSDHYLGTKFKLNLAQAQEFMAKRLSGSSVGETILEFDPVGKNTLFPLILGFDILADLCQKMVDESDTFLRCGSEIPAFSEYSKLQSFPFSHEALILDLRERDREKLLGLLKETSQSLTRAQVCNIRNRMEHTRTENEFPTKDEIEIACSAIDTTVRNLIDYGVCPSIYYFAGSVSDEYKRTIYKYKDFMNNEVSLSDLHQFADCGRPEYEKPMVIVPLLHIGDSAEPMTFEFEESSNYTRMWSNYPKRRNNDTK